MNICIALPVYNEQLVLEKNAQAVRVFCHGAFPDDQVMIVIADNASRDRTPAIAQQLAATYSDIQYLHVAERGKGIAWRTAFLKFEADCYVVMDVDLAVSLVDLPPLVEAIRSGSDLVIGSRFLAGSRVQRTALRTLTSRVYRFLAQRVLQSQISDFQCGFKALNRRSRDELLPQTTDPEFFLDTEIAVMAEALDYKITEIPVEWSAYRDPLRKSTVNIIVTTYLYLQKIWKLRRRTAALRIDKRVKVA